MSRFTILLGGPLTATPRLSRQIAGTRIIAADSGIAHAAPLGVTPELWVGDFDSASAADLAGHAGVERKTFPPEKDRTDGEIAVDEALARGAKSLLLAGAFGGARPDHAFLHLALAIRLAERGIPTLLSSGAEEGRAVLPGETRFDYAPGTLFSILGFSDLAGLSIDGAKWPLDTVETGFGSSLTLSNEVAGDLVVSLETGRALLLAYPEPA
jgi:thiamine pyrophosphokinase